MISYYVTFSGKKGKDVKNEGKYMGLNKKWDNFAGLNSSRSSLQLDESAEEGRYKNTQRKKNLGGEKEKNEKQYQKYTERDYSDFVCNDDDCECFSCTNSAGRYHSIVGDSGHVSRRIPDHQQGHLCSGLPPQA
jgi:hypothetical protein